MEHAPNKKTSSFIAPILILLGIALLLSNTGLLKWQTLFNDFPLWPLGLVALGIFFLFTKRVRVMGVLSVLGIGAGIYLFTPYFSQPADIALYSGADSNEISVALDTAKSVKVNLSPSVADLNLSASSNNSLFIQGEAETRNNEKLESSFRVADDGEARYRLTSKSTGRWFSNINTEGRNWDLQMNTSLPLDLNVDLGVGETFLDLTDFKLTHLNIDTGVGGTEIILPDQGQFDVNIGSGVGTTLLRIPAELPVSLNIDRGLTGLNIQGDFIQNGDTYQSPNFERSSQKVTIEIDSGVGAVEVIRF